MAEQRQASARVSSSLENARSAVCLSAQGFDEPRRVQAGLAFGRVIFPGPAPEARDRQPHTMQCTVPWKQRRSTGHTPQPGQSPAQSELGSAKPCERSQGKTGARMKSATERTSSTSAKIMPTIFEGREKPATQSAGETVAPAPKPSRSATAVMILCGSADPSRARAAAAPIRLNMPARTNTGR